MSSNENDSDSDRTDDVPSEILEKANIISMDSLPAKSKQEYTKEYNKFKEWRRTQNTSSFDESIFIVYFHELSKKLSSATLWAKYSKLRSTVCKFDGVDISKYKKLLGILKMLHANYVPKKSNIFTTGNITKFLNEAPDKQYLDVKTVSVIAIMGACRTCELVSLKYSAVEDHETMLLIKIPGIKTPIERSFIVHGKMYEICKKYMDLRPTNADQDRFFLNFQMGKCTRQPIGKHKISKMPQLIADFLDLPDAELFSGHAFRRTSATFLVDGGGDLLDLKRHGGWKSDKVAEGYVAESKRNKKRIATTICNDLHLGPSTSKATFTTIKATKNTAFDKAPTKKVKSSMTLDEDSDLTFDSMQVTYGSSSTEITTNHATQNIAEDDFNMEDLTVPDNFFDSENDVHEINVKTDNVSSPKNSNFQFNNCNVTINIVQKKSM